MISIVLPVVKTDYFEEALKSVLNQTHTDFELIIVNNEADEGFDAIVTSHKDPRIVIKTHKPRVPIIENWNQCLSYANRKYFILFSDDDVMEVNYLAEMMSLAKKYPNCRMLHTCVRSFSELTGVRDWSASAPEWEDGIGYVYETFVHGRAQLVSDFMWRTDHFKNQKGYVSLAGAWGSDEVTTYRMALSSDGGVVYCNKPLVNWRFSKENFTTNMKFKAHISATAEFELWMSNCVLGMENSNPTDERVVIMKREFSGIIQRRYISCLQNLGMGCSVLSPILFKLINKGVAKKILWRSVLHAFFASISKKISGVKSYRE
tara:strand:- start:129 stop:1085 length:957 start_codon:yes stop_codon:yes gene_type:complete